MSLEHLAQDLTSLRLWLNTKFGPIDTGSTKVQTSHLQAPDVPGPNPRYDIVTRESTPPEVQAIISHHQAAIAANRLQTAAFAPQVVPPDAACMTVKNGDEVCVFAQGLPAGEPEEIILGVNQSGTPGFFGTVISSSEGRSTHPLPVELLSQNGPRVGVVYKEEPNSDPRHNYLRTNRVDQKTYTPNSDYPIENTNGATGDKYYWAPGNTQEVVDFGARDYLLGHQEHWRTQREADDPQWSLPQAYALGVEAALAENMTVGQSKQLSLSVVGNSETEVTLTAKPSFNFVPDGIEFDQQASSCVDVVGATPVNPEQIVLQLDFTCAYGEGRFTIDTQAVSADPAAQITINAQTRREEVQETISTVVNQAKKVLLPIVLR